MRILHVASEATGLVKTGGLADVAAGLARAQRDAGDDVRLLLPAYRGCAQLANASVRHELGDPLGGGPTRLLEGRLPGSQVPVWLVDAPSLYNREGGPYLDTRGDDYPDNALRFAVLGRVAAMLSTAGPALGWAPEVVHAHDWQASLAPATLHWWGGTRPGTVTTVHNLRFQGRFSPDVVSTVGLPTAAYAVDGAEAYGTFSFLKAGLFYADRITTVSPTYAHEIQSEVGGEGLHGLLQSRSDRLHGLLNGIDEAAWDPRTDRALHAAFGPQSLGARATNKQALQRHFGLDEAASVPLVGLVSRLSDQKGIDLLLAALPALLRSPLQLVVLGSGDPALEAALRELAQQHPTRVGVHIGYDEGLSHQVFAGSDLFAVPSRFEPCGLTQMYAMRYGALPVVRDTGGLADTVTDVSAGGCGFTFEAPDADALREAVERALEVYGNRGRWAALQRQAMQRSFGWGTAARDYRDVYSAAIDDASST
ncbi:MAG: glycogen synthase GlgA [Nannocystaceae bacterium]|nr:glycogen synthase GlgA [Nannocystaceae bacterium]